MEYTVSIEKPGLLYNLAYFILKIKEKGVILPCFINCEAQQV